MFPHVHVWSWTARRWPGAWADRNATATYLSRQGDYLVLIEAAPPGPRCLECPH